MPLSGMPSVEGLSLPGGCTNVKVKSSAADTSSGSNKLDITTLSDEVRVYAEAPLIDAGAAADEGVTQSVTCTFFGTPPAVNTNPEAVGWVCTESEEEYAVGEMVKGTATFVYKTGGS